MATRVLGGTAKGRPLRVGRGLAIRPTESRLRGALFDILGSRFDLGDARLLDLFAGSGSLGIEALSRGAGFVVFVEKSPVAVRTLRENLVRCGFADRARVLQAPVEAALRRLASQGEKFDGVFVDPPYERGFLGPTLRALDRLGLLRPGGWVAVHRTTREPVEDRYGELRLTRERRYGTRAVSVYALPDEKSEGS
ncbi:MAG: rRNA methyltransferase [Candidatus Binatia bacterium]|nr:MAG: rRNA methyltransferase [Candidatus Binatia bacterium]